MASPDLNIRPPLTRAELEHFASEVSADRSLSLSALWLPIRPTEEETGRAVFGCCFLVMVRSGGFMLVCPASDRLQEALVELSSASGVDTVVSTGLVQVCTTRGRVLGEQEALLVDLPWEAAPSFTKATLLRGPLREAVLIPFTVGGSVGRPTAASAIEAGNTWIGEDMEHGRASDYVTGEDFDVASAPDSLGGADGEIPGEGVAELQDRIKALEAELAASRAPKTTPTIMTAAPKPLAGGTGSPSFFGQQKSQLNAGDWAKLKRVVGSPPAKLGAAEARRVAGAPARAAIADTFLAEEEKEAGNELDASLAMVNLDPETGDPFQRLLMSQMQQNTMLMTKLLGNKPNQDPMSNLLAAGGGNESGSSSSGARGCMAREMFMKQIQDLERVAALTRLHALQELGIPPEKEDSSLMRKYFERRVPLADQKLLAHFACLISEGWALATETENLQMLGFLARAAFFVEQTALDGGRLELSWLLTGFTEPNAQFHFSIKKTPGLKPFSRLIHPLWLSANIAYLRDLDFLENRLATLGKGKSSVSVSVEQEDNPDPKPKKRPKKPKKGGGKENSETRETV